MRRALTLLVGLLALLALYQFGARNRAPTIEADIQERTSARVAEAGFDLVSVSTDGRDVTLAGEVPDTASVDRVAALARRTRGVRVVDNTVGVAMVSAQICQEIGLVTLRGDAPGEAAVRDLAESATLLFPHATVDDQLGTRADTPDGFERMLEMLLVSLGQMEEGCARLEGRTAALSGKVRSQETAERIRMDVESGLVPGFRVDFDLDVPTLSEEAAACQRAYNERIRPGEQVLFDFDSAELHEEGRSLLREVAEIGELCPDVGVLVTGHCDSIGDRQYNVKLSQRRAQAVVDFLVDLGVDESRLTPVGMGFAQPIADNSTEDGRALNRRIEFRVREE